MKTVVILGLIVVCGYLSIMLAHERIELNKLRIVHTETVEQCGDVWLRIPTTQKLLDKINKQ